MLPYETELHAKQIFAKIMGRWMSDKGYTPSDDAAAILAKSVVRIAADFSALALEATPETSKPPSAKLITFQALALEWRRRALRSWSAEDQRRTLNRFSRYLFP